MKRITVLLIMGMIGVLAGCCKAGPNLDLGIDKIKERPARTSRAVEANNEFGFALFQKLRAEDASQNIFISPLSIFSALAMTYNGAKGETKQGMAQALQLGGLKQEELNTVNAYLMNMLIGLNPEVTLYLGNSLWGNKNVSFEPGFLERNRRFYGARTRSLDFGDPKVPGLINDWIKERTGGMIPKMIDKLDADDALFLINAIYFKGQWKKQFEKSNTAPAPFYLVDGKTKNHPLMKHPSGRFSYLENKDFQALGLDFGDKRQVGMYFFLPKKGAQFDRFLSSMDNKTFARTLEDMRLRKGRVEIPRYKMAYGIKKLNETLKQLGMKQAFTSDADFSGMSTKTKLAVSQVLHKALLEVYEEGAKAAAATVVGVKTTSVEIDPNRPFVFRADRPFFFAIVDHETKLILFMGALYEP